MRRKPNLKEWIDLYCCRNPFCAHRLHIVSHGSPPPKHCRIRPRFLNSMHREHWFEIVKKNEIEVHAIKARIEARKILEERKKVA